jgi:hypothetical protein
MELTPDLLTFTEAPVHPPVDAEWFHRIVKKRAERKALTPVLDTPPAELHAIALSEKFVREVPIKRALLSHDEIQITETSPRRLLRKLAGSDLTAEEVLRAFIKRATIAQELVGTTVHDGFEQCSQKLTCTSRRMPYPKSCSTTGLRRRKSSTES